MIEIHLSLVYDEEPGKYNSVHKTVNLPAVPRVGDYLSIDDLEDEIAVTEVHFDLYQGVGIVAGIRDSEDLQKLLERGWDEGV